MQIQSSYMISQTARAASNWLKVWCLICRGNIWRIYLWLGKILDFGKKQIPLVRGKWRWGQGWKQSNFFDGGSKKTQIQIHLANTNTHYLWGKEGDDGGEVGNEPEESEAGEDHSLAPELKLLPHLGSALWYQSIDDLTGYILCTNILSTETLNRTQTASKPAHQTFWVRWQSTQIYF